VAFVCDLQQKMPNVRGNNLFQVFCNLVKNALDAMPRGGRLMIRTRLAAQRVRIEFEDTGVGLPADAERIFDAFYTTKPPGKGTGLGLAICRDLIQRYQGRIWAENREQGGAIFFITIPLESCVPAAESKPMPGVGEQA
jgi:signal transduction histidine kinase